MKPLLSSLEEHNRQQLAIAMHHIDSTPLLSEILTNLPPDVSVIHIRQSGSGVVRVTFLLKGRIEFNVLFSPSQETWQFGDAYELLTKAFWTSPAFISALSDYLLANSHLILASQS